MGILNVDNLRGVGSGTSVTCLSNRLETTNINASGIVTATGGFTGTLNTAAQGNITSLGTLNGLAIDQNQDISMNASVTGQLIVGGNGYTSAIALDADAMHIYHNSSSRALVFGTNETERLRITGAGKIGIGTNVPDGNLHVHNSNAGSVSAAGDANEFVIESAANVGMSFLTGATSLSRIKFGDTTANNRGIFYFNHSDQSFNFQQTSSNKLKIKSDGDVSIIDGNLVVAHGHGIDFSANTNDESGAGSISANGEILDDYEEGSWTPVADGAGTITGTSINYAGFYTKVGRVVHLEFYANNSAGDIEISNYKIFSGVPFATGSGNYGTGRIMTEDGDIVARQGDIIVGGSSFLINNCGSSSGTVRLSGTVTYIAT